jgi:gamma-glutamyltranspeptidase/glutathione hydrolase
MGGEAQIQIHMQLLVRILALGQDPADAVSAPRWVKHGEGAMLAEEGLPDLGAEVIPRSDAAGHAHVILNTDRGLAAASDPRCDGLAAGY